MRQLIILILILFVLFPQILYADEIFVPVDDYPPWKIIKNNRDVSGIDITITNALLKPLGIAPRYGLYPWKRCLLMMKIGEADLISGITKSNEREEYLYYLFPPYKTHSTKTLFVKKGIGTHYTRFLDLKHKTIGFLRGAKYFDKFHNNSEIIKKEINSDLQGMKMVIAGRLDAFLMTRENGEYLLQENPLLMERLEQTTWEYNKDIAVYFAVSKNSQLLLRKDELEQSLRVIVASGGVEKIMRDYFK